MRAIRIDWPMIWGGLDFASFVVLIIFDARNGRIPLFSEISHAHDFYQAYGSSSPVLLSWGAGLLELSFIASGFLLLKRRRLGRYFAFCQFPLRVIFLMPSLFFLNYLGYMGASAVVVMAALLVSEILKLWSLRKL
ncbi:hypothetical protein [Stenotrophomonas sp. TWI1183]|uniref:hypothetical protein n=1 Tax=Stenotrophomonas sp. TWI1183 TaxID=3136799 RepID=UPI003209A893